MFEQIKKIVEAAKKKVAERDAKIKKLAEDLEAEKNRNKAESLITIPEIRVKMPERMDITNFPAGFDVKNFPKSFDITNFPKTQGVEIVNHKEIQKVTIENQKDVQKVELTNPPEVAEKGSTWVPSLVKMAVEKMADICIKIATMGVVVKFDAAERDKPFPVVVVDIYGRPVGVQSPSQVVIPMGGAGTGGSKDASPPSVIGSGNASIVTPGVPVAIAGRTPCKKVVLCAPSSNTGEVYVGGANVSAANGSEVGIVLLPIGMTTLEINDLSKIYIDATVAGEGVSFTYMA